MARKDLLKGLMEGAAPENKSAGGSNPQTEPKPPQNRRARGAIGAVSQSIEALKARSIIEIDPHLIDAGGLQDRLEDDSVEDAALLSSIREYGQQVPILVRPHPDHEDRYQIVYGRRRVLAHRDLQRPIKAMVRDLDDDGLVMAQGQENNARRGLSFIEKANFAGQMRDAGYDRKAICDALSVDKTIISRMLSIIDRIGFSLVEYVGSAPNIGRDRWIKLANALEKNGITPVSVVAKMEAEPEASTSDQRFEDVMDVALGKDSFTRKSVSKPAQSRVTRLEVNSSQGLPIAAVSVNAQKAVLTIDRAESGGFENWLVENLEEIHGRWLASRRDEPEQ